MFEKEGRTAVAETEYFSTSKFYISLNKGIQTSASADHKINKKRNIFTTLYSYCLETCLYVLLINKVNTVMIWTQK